MSAAAAMPSHNQMDCVAQSLIEDTLVSSGNKLPQAMKSQLLCQERGAQILGGEKLCEERETVI